MARLRHTLVKVPLAADITAGATTITFTAPLREFGEDNIATIAAPDTLTLRIGYEILHVTAYTSGASTATVLRGQEGSTATAHNEGDIARHVVTDLDLPDVSAYAPLAGATFTGDVSVPDEAYDATAWNGSLEVPTKNAVRDKIETIGSGTVSDAAYGAGWNGDTTTAPSKNAVYDKIETISAGTSVNGVKDPVRVATAAVLPNSPTYSAGVYTAGANAAIVVDGVSLAANDRVLVKDQATGSRNGIYTVTTVGSGAAPWVLTRATDFDTSAEIVSGMSVRVSEGTVHAGTAWVLSTTGAITLDTTSLTFISSTSKTSWVHGDGSANHTTTSSSLADVNAAYALTIPAVVGDVLEVEFEGTVEHSTASGNFISFAVNVSGTGDKAVQRLLGFNSTGLAFLHSIRVFHTVVSGDITGGLVTVKPRWRTSAGTATIRNESTNNQKPVMSVTNRRQ